MPRPSYFRDPEGNAQVYLEDGWTRTGDLGRVDNDGNLFVIDRYRDNIVRGTQTIWSLEIEDVYYEHGAVREAAAFSVSDDVLGEEIAIALVLKGPVTIPELQRFARERLMSYQVPRHFFFVDKLPRNANGKVLKRQLGQWFSSKQSSQESHS